MKKLAVAYHRAFLEHDAGPGHPERPERVEAVMAAIREAPWFDSVEVVEAGEAAVEDLARVHDPKYIKAMRRLCEAGGEFLPSLEANVGPETYPAALRAAGAGLTLAKGIMNGDWGVGFAPTRPPGHHAVHNRPKGFCIFNNIAVLARHIMAVYGLERVGIIDFDIHHGNGTESAFWTDPRVLFCSIHRDNLFPYDSGRRADSGEGDGAGYTINIPLDKDVNDAQYLEAFDRYALPKFLEYGPEFLLVSAGFDAHHRDIIGGMKLTAAVYQGLAERILTVSTACAGGRIIALLEGGYDLTGLQEGITTFLGRLLEG